MGSSSMMDGSEQQKYELDSQGLQFGKKNVIDMLSSEDESQQDVSAKQVVLDVSDSQGFDGSYNIPSNQQSPVQISKSPSINGDFTEPIKEQGIEDSISVVKESPLIDDNSAYREEDSADA